MTLATPIDEEIALAPAKAEKEHFQNDIGFADAFVARHRGDIRFVTNEECWLAFSTAQGWRRDPSGGLVKALAVDYAREHYTEALELAKSLDPDKAMAEIRRAADLGNRKRIEPMLSFAKINRDVAVDSSQLDREPFLVGVRNGFIDLTDGQFHSHRRDKLITRHLAVDFDEDATAGIFERFLAEVQPDDTTRAFLQRWAGYCLTGAIREHVLLFHYGTGSNGKGIFLEHALLRLAGEYGSKLSDGLIYSNDRGTQPFLEIAGLCGKRLAVGEENAAGAGLNENFLKSATGGDRQKGRFHYANFVEYDPTAKFALVGNHQPRVEGRDHGFWRRFLLVDWPIKIPNHQQDTALPEKLLAELPGILNWCIEGAREWLVQGLQPPEACRAATERFKTNSDSLAGFVEGFKEVADSWALKARVFALYQKWADEEGIPKARQLTKRSLSFRLVERGWAEGRCGDGRHHCWLGIQEVESWENTDV